MEVVHLRKKSVIPVEINGVDCICVLDNASIDHFQRTNNEGLLKFYERLASAEQTGKVEVTPIIKLLGSLLREKKTGRFLGEKYLREFDSMDILKYLAPILTQAFTHNLPEAKEDNEKK